MRKKHCGSCWHEQLVPFLDLGTVPVADRYTATPTEEAPAYPLELGVCAKCYLVQVLENVNQLELFTSNYSFYSSASPPLSAYHEAYAERVLADWPAQARGFVVEIGCNDGDLLRHFADAGAWTLGVDPASGPVAVARDRGLKVRETAFTSDVALEIYDSHGRASVVIANHVVAHVQDVADVLAGVAALLHADGVAFIEVQYLPDLLVNNAFDLVYHEHGNFFSLTTLEHAAARWGLYVIDAKFTDRQNGSLRVTLRQRSRPDSTFDDIRRSEKWLSCVDSYAGVQGRVNHVRVKLWETISTLRDAGARVAGYGAPAKATTLLNFCGIGSDQLDFIVDLTPAKLGRYVPGTGVEIVSEEFVKREHTDVLLLLAWTYLSAVLRRHTEFTRDGGSWVVPLPSPVII